MRIALAQLNPSVGDLQGNAQLILDWADKAKDNGSDLLVTPELALTGYPPQDLLYKQHFISDQLQILREQLVPALPLPALIGFVDRDDEGRRYNAAALISDGSINAVIHKTLLPTYDVFDEARYFTPGRGNAPIEFGGLKLGVTICEDLWDEEYGDKVVPALAAQGAQLIINLSSSPYHLRKGDLRITLLKRHTRENGLAILYCNLVGAQDELIFDGDSLVMRADGELVARGAQFEAEMLLMEVGTDGALVGAEPRLGPSEESKTATQRSQHGWLPTAFSEEAELYGALCLGISDYFRKCGFNRAVIGLSGGIDSAVVACFGARALGTGNVIGIAMPSRYNAPESTRDARALADALGIEFHVLPIEESVQLAMQRFTAEFGDYAHGLTVENLQARERGKTLMEVSNDRGALVLSTGNKTEYALGYTTLYGDMCGGLAVLGDVDKPQVYRLGRWFNEQAGREIIPAHTLSRPPSAELRSGQVDPFDYDRISPLADLVIEEHLAPEQLLAMGYTENEVETVLRLVRISEYKRRQAPPILRVSEKAFGIGRRMPIANGYRL